MPGSYYSDVERTIYLTYVTLREDVAKYDDLFQQERKFLHEKVCANVQIDPNPQRAAQVIIGATNTAHLFSCFFAVACFFGRLLLVGVPASATRL